MHNIKLKIYLQNFRRMCFCELHIFIVHIICELPSRTLSIYFKRKCELQKCEKPVIRLS